MAGPPYLYVREGQAYDKVAGPVAEAGEGHGGRPRPLAEQLGHDEPRDGAGTNLKETDKEEDGRHADVAHPREAGLQERTRQVGGGRQFVILVDKDLFFCLADADVLGEQIKAATRGWERGCGRGQTWSFMPIVMATAQQHIPAIPTRHRVRLPARSTSTTCGTQRHSSVVG